MVSVWDKIVLQCFQSVWWCRTNANSESLNKEVLLSIVLLEKKILAPVCSPPSSPVKPQPNPLTGGHRFKWCNRSWPSTPYQRWHERSSCKVKLNLLHFPLYMPSWHEAVWEAAAVQRLSTLAYFCESGGAAVTPTDRKLNYSRELQTLEVCQRHQNHSKAGKKLLEAKDHCS